MKDYKLTKRYADAVTRRRKRLSEVRRQAGLKSAEAKRKKKQK